MNDLQKKAYANSLSTSARIQALETIFWSYIKVSEEKDTALKMRSLFLTFYKENLSALMSQQPNSLGDEIVQYLKSEQKETDAHLADLEKNWFS